MDHNTKLTLDYYKVNADKFITETENVNFSAVQDRFLSYIPAHGRILDFGCGSGRDTKYFLEKGYDVDAIDGSPELCSAASALTGISVQNMLFQDLKAKNIYDGIWACSSILHLSSDELQDVLRKMSDALKPGGIMYISFKYGTYEGLRNGRYFNDMTEEKWEKVQNQFPELALLKSWKSEDVRPGREDEKWLNLILRKVIG